MNKMKRRRKLEQIRKSKRNVKIQETQDVTENKGKQKGGKEEE